MNTRMIATTLILAMLAAPVAYADTRHEHPMPVESQAMAQSMTDGEVKKLDMKRSMVTLKHADVPGVMAAMTMAYRAADPRELEGLKAGDKVRFTMEKQGEEYVLTHIESMRQ